MPRAAATDATADLDALVRRLERRWVPAAAYRRAAAAMAAADRFDDADRVLRRGLASFPGRPMLLVEFARSAHHAGRYAEAVARWRSALDAGSKDPLCYPALAANLRMLGEIEEAQRAIDEALRRWPAAINVTTEAARIAMARHRLDDALVFWDAAAAALPEPHPDVLQGRAQTLVRLARYDEADAMLAAAATVFPDHRGLIGLRGMVATAREDWPAAIALWTAYRRTYPDDPTGWEQLGIAVQGRQLAGGVDEPAIPAEIEVLDDEPLRRLMLGFESLGFDCEFGLVQRRFGAEPPSLLRFNDVQPRNLMLALDDRFAGMGEPDLTTLIVSSTGEYYVADIRWNLGMHTFLFATQHEAKVLLPKMCRRVAFLRDKLVADLRSAEKIFVLKGNGIELKELRILHRKLRTFGPVCVLHVREAGAPFAGDTAPAQAGTVVALAPDLFVGFLSRMGNAQFEWNIAFDEWVEICRRTRELAARAASEASARAS